MSEILIIMIIVNMIYFLTSLNDCLPSRSCIEIHFFSVKQIYSNLSNLGLSHLILYLNSFFHKFFCALYFQQSVLKF